MGIPAGKQKTKSESLRNLGSETPHMSGTPMRAEGYLLVLNGRQFVLRLSGMPDIL